MGAQRHWVQVNRAAVLTAWAAVVAECMGIDRAAALTLGRAVAGLSAYSKGKRLGVVEPSDPEEKKRRKREGRRKGVERIELMKRNIPVLDTDDGLRAVRNNKPMDPDSVQRYLAGKFGDALDDTLAAMRKLARSRSKKQLESEANALYEDFRPNVAGGKRGWGAQGRLSLDRIRSLAEEA
jgi:hypothetical protein